MNSRTKEQLDAAWYSIKLGNDNSAIQALYWAVLELATLDQDDPRVFRHDWTPEELAQQESPVKPLTLKDLRDQVNEEYARWDSINSVWKTKLSDQLSVWIIGDFEIRRRK